MQTAVYVEVGSNYFYSVQSLVCVETGQKVYTIPRSSLNFTSISGHFRGSKFLNFLGEEF